MQDLKVFTNEEFGQVRVLEIGNEPWLVGKDVANKLGYKDTSGALKKHIDDDEKMTRQIADSLGRLQNTTIINESGLYSLIIGSKLPSAKRFKKWVTSEVLPTIRKHGAYMTPETIEQTLSNPDFIIGLATRLKEEQQARGIAERQLKEQKPLVTFAETCISSKDSVLVRDVAKIASKNGISVGEKRLYRKLREWKMILKNSTEPYQSFIDRGFFEVVQGSKETSYGNILYQTTKVTPRGQVYIIEKLKDELRGEMKCKI